MYFVQLFTLFYYLMNFKYLIVALNVTLNLFDIVHSLILNLNTNSRGGEYKNLIAIKSTTSHQESSPKTNPTYPVCDKLH